MTGWATKTTSEAPFGLFRDWQRTQTQSSVRTLWSLRQQMDVRFCGEQEPKAERHCCVTTDSDQTNNALSRAPRRFRAFLLTMTYMDARHPVAFIHQLVKLIVRHSLSVTRRSRRDGLRADHNDSAVGDVIPISIMFRVIADVLAVRYRDAFVENGFTNLAA